MQSPFEARSGNIPSVHRDQVLMYYCCGEADQSPVEISVSLGPGGFCGHTVDVCEAALLLVQAKLSVLCVFRFYMSMK